LKARLERSISEKNMRTALFIILAAAVCAGMPGFCLGAEQVPTAFVGSFVGIAKIECESSPDCRSLSFSPAVIQDLTHSSRYVIDKLQAGLDYKVQGNRAECMRGILVEDMYKRLRPELVEDLNAR
jgi:hypothetical protein